MNIKASVGRGDRNICGAEAPAVCEATVHQSAPFIACCTAVLRSGVEMACRGMGVTGPAASSVNGRSRLSPAPGAPMLSRYSTILIVSLLCLGLPAPAMSVTPQSADSKPTVTNLAPVAVSGALPGPALWKVTKDGHVLWVLGVTSPLPRKMQWETATIERAVSESQAVLKPPGLELGAHVGFWGRLFLIPSMIGIKKLPDGKTLHDVLSPALYARWKAQREKYLGSSWGTDRLRPMFAGEKLYAAAIKHSDLTSDGGVEDQVLAFARHDHVPVVNTSYVVIMKDPRADARLFKTVSMADQQCLSGILDATEEDLSQATVRANAWATGDLTALRKALSRHQQDQCLSAVGGTEFAQKMGMTDVAQRIKYAWLKAAETSLAKNQKATALLPMDQLLSTDGYLAALQARGFEVTAPQE